MNQLEKPTPVSEKLFRNNTDIFTELFAWVKLSRLHTEEIEQILTSECCIASWKTGRHFINSFPHNQHTHSHPATIRKYWKCMPANIRNASIRKVIDTVV